MAFRWIGRRQLTDMIVLLLLLGSGWLPAQDGQSTPASPPESAIRTGDGTSLPDWKPDANGNLSQEQMQHLFRIVADKDMENDRKLRNYTYTEHDEEHILDNKVHIKSTELKTYEVLELYGEPVQRLTEKGNKPLDARDAAKEEEKIQKIIDKRKNESEDERKKREQKEEKDRENSRRFVTEVADAYYFKLIGSEDVAGREAWVIDAEPRPDFVPHMKESKFLSKFRGRVWIDKSDLQLAKLDVECLDTVSWGVFLARFHKGSRFLLEQTRVNDEVWLPRQLTAKVDVRLALLKNVDADIEQNFRDYKKFRATSRVVSVEEVQSR